MRSLHSTALPLVLAMTAIFVSQSLAGGDFTVKSGAAEIDVRIDSDVTAPQEAGLRKWIETDARAVATYYGRFPVPRVLLRIHLHGGAGIGDGVTYEGRLIRISVGRATSAAGFADDWMLTHEMFHLGFPDLDDRYNWMGEGLSTYLEPIARVRIGAISQDELWRGMLEGLPAGLPARGARGLDNTHTWGATYWGGAMFWFLADIAIREKTQNSKSLDDAIRAILRAGGDGSAHWELNDLLEKGDRATGTTVLEDLHRAMGLQPKAVDLDGLWRRLGVELKNKRVTYDDRAPLATIRRSMAGTSR